MFGQIAAANALSHVYAMGGVPKLALNVVAFPNCLGPEVLEQILRGGADKVMEAGAVLAGGHTINDKEPKYGLCVTGMCIRTKCGKITAQKKETSLFLPNRWAVEFLTLPLRQKWRLRKKLREFRRSWRS